MSHMVSLPEAREISVPERPKILLALTESERIHQFKGNLTKPLEEAGFDTLHCSDFDLYRVLQESVQSGNSPSAIVTECPVTIYDFSGAYGKVRLFGREESLNALRQLKVITGGDYKIVVYTGATYKELPDERFLGKADAIIRHSLSPERDAVEVISSLRRILKVA
jgi:hypothetical protein